MNTESIKNSLFYAAFLICCFYSPIVSATEEMIFKPVIEENNEALKEKFLKMHYDETVFDLAYKTFAFNGNVRDAFALSYAAVDKLPNSILWRERLVQTALWTNHVPLALDELTYLVEKENQLKYLPQAIKIARQMNLYAQLISLLEYQYKHNPNDPQAVIDLANAYNSIGKMNLAIQFLHQANNKNPNKEFLLLIATMYNKFGQYQDESKIVNEIELHYGVDEKTAMLAAQIDFNEANPFKALNALISVPNKELINDPNYWNTIASLAWMVGAYETARHAYLKLYSLDKLDESGTEQLLLLQPKEAERQTVEIAVNGWNKYHNINMFLQAVTIAIDLKDVSTLNALYQSSFSSSDLIKLGNKADYWNGQVFILQQNGQQKAARDLLLSAVLSHSHNDDIQLLYLNLLADQLNLCLPEQQPEYLKNALMVWQNKAATNDEWVNAYERGLVLFDRPKIALSLYQLEYVKQAHEITWYNSYAGILEQLDYAKSAYNVRLFNWQRIQTGLNTHLANDFDFWQTYDELAGYFDPDVVYPLSSYLAANDISSGGPDSLLTWAMTNNHYELAVYLANYYYPDGLPAWAALKLALMQNNQTQLRNLLTNMAPVLPRKERVEAASQIRDIPLAQTLAVDGMQHAPDSEKYKAMTEVLLQTADTVTATAEYEQFGNLQGPRAIVKSKDFLNNEWSISPYAKFWDARTNNSGDLGSRSYAQKSAGFILTDMMYPNNINLDVRATHALYGYTSIKWYAQYALSTHLTVNGTVGYNLFSTLDTFMLAAGMQNEAIGTISYDFDSYDKLVSTLELDRYYLQNRIALGNGTLLSAEYDHKFWLDYPDFTIQLNGSINRFNHYYPVITGTVLEIIPSSVPLSAANLLVKNFWQPGINFMFGDAIRQEYTHAWRPYANIGILYASTSGLGTDLDMGVAGSVIGRDKLSLYCTRSSTNQGKAQVNFLIGLSYQIYI